MESKEKLPVQNERGLSNPKKLVVAAGVLICVFLLGFIPSYLSARDARERNNSLEHKLTLTDMHIRLGMASFEANRNNFASASEMSTDFFNRLKDMTGATSDESLKQKLEAISSRRDEITTNLAQADPAVKEKLAQMYADFFQITTRQ